MSKYVDIFGVEVDTKDGYEDYGNEHDPGHDCYYWEHNPSECPAMKVWKEGNERNENG